MSDVTWCSIFVPRITVVCIVRIYLTRDIYEEKFIEIYCVTNYAIN